MATKSNFDTTCNRIISLIFILEKCIRLYIKQIKEAFDIIAWYVVCWMCVVFYTSDIWNECDRKENLLNSHKCLAVVFIQNMKR